MLSPAQALAASEHAWRQLTEELHLQGCPWDAMWVLWPFNIGGERSFAASRIRYVALVQQDGTFQPEVSICGRDGALHRLRFDAEPDLLRSFIFSPKEAL